MCNIVERHATGNRENTDLSQYFSKSQKIHQDLFQR